MSRFYLPCFSLMLPLLMAASPSVAHSIVGNRTFPATLIVEDPGVSDELTLPQVSRFKTADEDGGPSAWQTAVSAEYSKRLTKDFALSVESAWLDNHGSTGWDNIGVGAKYVFFQNPEHETMASVGLNWDIGHTGTKRVGAEDFSNLTPTVYFGKGLGDLPDSMAYLKPFALTGTLGYGIPTRNFSRDADTGDKTRNPQALEWGFTVQYSLPYLQQHVKDIGLPRPFNAAVPVVEFAFETPTGGGASGQTTGTINPGIILMGDKVQLGLEAQIPLDSDSGSGIGYVAQLHFYLDNLFPTGIGKPIW